MSTVLLIDDDPEFLDAFEAILSRAGYQVLRAGDGTEGIRMLRELGEEISLAVIDLSLPEVNGFEIIGAITRRPNNVKMLVTTAVFRDSQLEVASALGAHAVLRKPPRGSPLPAVEWLGTVRKLIGVPRPTTTGEGRRAQNSR